MTMAATMVPLGAVVADCGFESGTVLVAMDRGTSDPVDASRSDSRPSRVGTPGAGSWQVIGGAAGS